ncbi:MAG: hypothetical protein H6810_04850 [Phycisphaeraceae bacterium]|nr:MAG: hypothetical protein H6810_04850 [Phycisphaeraceae bacterium]
MRTTLAIRAGVLALAATVIAVSLAVLGSNTNARFDLTFARRHELGERTMARLRTLDEPLELVVAVDRRRIDRRARDRVDDVLAAFDHASPDLSVTFIDTGSPRGPELYDDLLARLRVREAPRRQQLEDEAARLIADANSLEAELGSLDTAASTAAGVATAHAPRLQQFAAFARVAAKQLGEAADAAASDTEKARAAAGVAGKLAPQFEVVVGELGQMEGDPPSDEARLRVRNAARVADSIRGHAAALAQRGANLGQTDLDRVSKALETGEAALLIGPPRDAGPGLVAIDLDELYPPSELFDVGGAAAEAATADRAEQLASSALAVLADPARPVVVFVHGVMQRWVGQAGALTGLLERLAHEGIDYAEWAAAIEPSPPDLTEIDPSGTRPVVYAIIGPDSTTTARPSDPNSKSGTEIAQRIGEVVRGLVDQGKPVLVNLAPSVFPTFGDADPVADPLASYGITAQSGTPIFASTPGANGPIASTLHRVVPERNDQAISDAIAGLPMAIERPVPLTLDGDAMALLTLPASDDRWAETQWLRYFRTPANQRHLLPDQPRFDADQGDARGPWIIAAAGRGPSTRGERPRAVVVGANTWFLDRAWRSQQVVNGRPLLVNPGNVEFFDAAVLWLAGRDELIAPSPSARPIALIRPISPGTLGAIRWGLIGGLPLLILIAGGAHRVMRG